MGKVPNADLVLLFKVLEALARLVRLLKFGRRFVKLAKRLFCSKLGLAAGRGMTGVGVPEMKTVNLFKRG